MTDMIEIEVVLDETCIEPKVKIFTKSETAQVEDIIHAIENRTRKSFSPIPVGEIRIHHAGDTVRYEGMLPKLQAFGRIDMQLLPINGRDAKRYKRNCIGNMTYQEAADLAGEVSPSIVIPGHWDMFADNSADPHAFADYLEVKYEGRIRCVIPKVMEEIELMPGEK